MMIGASAAVQRGVGPQAAVQGRAHGLRQQRRGHRLQPVRARHGGQSTSCPSSAVVYNNDCWGMWPSAVSSARSMHLYLFQENLRYDKMAEGLGARGEYVRTPEELREALKRSYQAATKEKPVDVDQLPGHEGIHLGQIVSAGRGSEPRTRLRRRVPLGEVATRQKPAVECRCPRRR